MVVSCPGNGEADEGLHAIFKAAWEAKSDTPVPLYGPGHNMIPTMHVADLAAYVAAVCLEPPAQQYLLAVDSLRLTQREIVTAIAQSFGDTPVKELSMEELYFQKVLCLKLAVGTCQGCVQPSQQLCTVTAAALAGSMTEVKLHV